MVRHIGDGDREARAFQATPMTACEADCPCIQTPVRLVLRRPTPVRLTFSGLEFARPTSGRPRNKRLASERHLACAAKCLQCRRLPDRCLCGQGPARPQLHGLKAMRLMPVRLTAVPKSTKAATERCDEASFVSGAKGASQSSRSHANPKVAGHRARKQRWQSFHNRGNECPQWFSLPWAFLPLNKKVSVRAKSGATATCTHLFQECLSPCGMSWATRGRGSLRGTS